MTATENVQFAPPFRLPPFSETVPDPGFAVTTLLEPQLPLSPLGSSTIRPLGSASVSEMPLKLPLAFGLVIVIDSALVPPTPIELGTNALATDGGLVAARATAGRPSTG